MTHDTPARTHAPNRRAWLRQAGVWGAAAVGGTLAPFPARADSVPSWTATQAATALNTGSCVLALRHADAPGTFDPPGFRLGDCSTQRNLGEVGQAQARRIGLRLREAGAVPSRVRSSPWCRCLDTAALAFGRAEPWAALGSPVGTQERTYREQIETLQQALRAVKPWEAWVTHMFVLRDLTGVSVASGESLVLAMSPNRGGLQVLGRLHL